MASEELKSFLGDINTEYEQYAERLYDSSFTDVDELAAETLTGPVKAGVPKVPARVLQQEARDIGRPSNYTQFDGIVRASLDRTHNRWWC